MSHKLAVSGRTTDGKSVIRGVFWLVASDGVPIEVIVAELKGKGHVVDCVDFYDTAKSEGWNPASIQLRIEMAVGEVYGLTYREAVSRRIQLHTPRKA